jgi:hypothetical protein
MCEVLCELYKTEAFHWIHNDRIDVSYLSNKSTYIRNLADLEDIPNAVYIFDSLDYFGYHCIDNFAPNSNYTSNMIEYLDIFAPL